MKAFYQQPSQARRALKVLKEKGLHVSHVNYYKKAWGHVENFNARGTILRRIVKYIALGALGGFVAGCVGAFILLSLGVVNTFQDMGFTGTILAIGMIGAFVVPPFTAAIAAVFSEDKVDVDEADFNGDEVVVDFHVEVEERDKAESLLKENGAHNVIYE